MTSSDSDSESRSPARHTEHKKTTKSTEKTNDNDKSESSDSKTKEDSSPSKTTKVDKVDTTNSTSTSTTTISNSTKLPPRTLPFVPHYSMPEEKEGGKKVVYCPKCGMPAEYCVYGPTWEICKLWCLEKFPECYPEFAGMDIATLKQQATDKQAELDAKKREKETSSGAGKKAKTADSSSTTQGSASSDINKNIIHVTVNRRMGRKLVTIIKGLDLLVLPADYNDQKQIPSGLKFNDEMAKKCKKKFACGAAAVTLKSGENVVEIQGNCQEDDIKGVLKKEFGLGKDILKKMDYLGQE